MKFVTVNKDEQSIVGVLDRTGKNFLPLDKHEFPETMIGCIELGDDLIKKVQAFLEKASDEEFLSLSSVELQAPIPRPQKNIFCVGKNYAEHAIEMGSKDDIPEHVMIFTKAPTTVIAANETIPLHKTVTEQLDYEGELAVIIGKKGTAIPQENAFEYVFGYTIVNDVTGRDLQKRHKQFFIGKSLDGSCPLGPWIVHKSAVINPGALNIETKVNGEVRQASNTKNFIFSIPEIIAVLSKGMTLEPGDIIATGTPAGVGKGFKPPRFLKTGDEIEITIDQIGTLKNTVGE
ncbi:fumarylacetoacetate hydrolase family protein [Bacillaceae bacterium Marseille-Q3522]|nr:fumarylacetoacetate hydrolase family protein [Bacillaceae bacterium Marseille-Q3522]